MNEYEEQQAIERIALARYPEATGVKEIQPIVTPDKQPEMWLVILSTGKEFEFITTVVTAEDISGAAQ